jgi:hypothetical protein
LHGSCDRQFSGVLCECTVEGAAHADAGRCYRASPDEGTSIDHHAVSLDAKPHISLLPHCRFGTCRCPAVSLTEDIDGGLVRLKASQPRTTEWIDVK